MAADEGSSGAVVPVSLTFLYRLTPGAADASFGLNVARMAGLPPAVVVRAAQVAARMKGGGPAASPVLNACQRTVQALRELKDSSGRGCNAAELAALQASVLRVLERDRTVASG